MEINIRKAEEQDIEVIHQLATEIWRKHYPGIITEAQIEYMLSKMYSADSLWMQMKDGHQFYLAVHDNQPLGYYSYSEQNNCRYFLNKLYIKTVTQRKGTGNLLLNHLESQLPQKSELRLTVNRKNFKAINFYFKNGFVIEEAADFDIGEGFYMNDFVMLKSTSVYIY